MDNYPPIPKTQQELDRERAERRKAARDAIHGNVPWFEDPLAAPKEQPTVEQEIENELRRIQREHGYDPDSFTATPWGLMNNEPAPAPYDITLPFGLMRNVCGPCSCDDCAGRIKDTGMEP